jgi:hypothetical protein
VEVRHSMKPSVLWTSRYFRIFFDVFDIFADSAGLMPSHGQASGKKTATREARERE